MHHLIVGAGNMGRKHSAILKDLGDTTQLIDLDYKPDNIDWQSVDSALICTPPDTHADVYNSIPRMVPTFLEKPVVSDLSQTLANKPVTMVACNWRFCPHIKPLPKVIVCEYPAKDSYWPLDLIHFADLLQDKPYTLSLDHDTATLFAKDQSLVAMVSNSDNTSTRIDGRPAHTDICRMFYSQMILWRSVASGTMQSPNPVAMALARTTRLMAQLGEPQTVSDAG